MADLGIEENAAERKFGPEFDDIHILSNAQVAVILQVSAGQAVTRDEELNDVYRKTQKYVERFNQMANKEKEHQGTNATFFAHENLRGSPRRSNYFEGKIICQTHTASMYAPPSYLFATKRTGGRT